MAKNKFGVVDESGKTGEGSGDWMEAGTSLNAPHPSPFPPAGEGTGHDKFHGQGGSYIVDAATQTRVQNK